MTEDNSSSADSTRQSVPLKTGADHALSMSTVFDYGFEREEGFILLSFSVRDPQPEQLLVLMYECDGSKNSTERRQAIRLHAASGGPAYLKSSRFYEVAAGDTPEGIVTLFGLANWGVVLDHHLNRWLTKSKTGTGGVSPGDIIYIPQLIVSEGAIAVGDMLETEETDESVERGKRYLARWDIEQSGYDPLDWQNWIPELNAGVLSNTAASSGAGPLFQRNPYRPQFVVLSGPAAVLGISPNPLELIRETELVTDDETGEGKVFFADGSSRDLAAGAKSESIAAEEEPVGFLFN